MRIAAKWGIILGITICVWTLALHALGFYTTAIARGQIADIVATAFPIATIVFALRERLRENPLSFAQVVSTAFILGMVSVAITIPFFWWYHHVLNPEWSELIVAHIRESMLAASASPGDIEAAVASQRSSATDAAQLTGAIIGTALFSTVIGLVAGAVLKLRARRADVNVATAA